MTGSIYGRYRYIATRLDAPGSKIAELPLSGVQWERLRNGAGAFSASLKMPTFATGPHTDYVPGVAALQTSGSAVSATAPWLGVVGDLELVATVTLPDLTPASAESLISVETTTGGTKRVFRLQHTAAGRFALQVSDSGSAYLTSASSGLLSANGFVDGSKFKFRIRFLRNDGAGNRVTSFDVSTDGGGTWVAMGAPVSQAGAITSLFPTTGVVLTVGANPGGINLCNAIFHEVYVRDGFDGPILDAADFTAQTAGAASFTSSLDGNLWTVTGSPGLVWISPPSTTTIPPDNATAQIVAALYKEATIAGETCVYVLRDDVPMGGWIIWEREYDPATQTVKLAGAEFGSYFKRRYVEGVTLETEVSFTNTPAIIAATQLITAVNEIGLTFDIMAGASDPVTVSWKGTDGKTVADAIAEIADPADGFDWRTDVRFTEGNFERVWIARPTLGGVNAAFAKDGATLVSGKIRQRGSERTNDTIAFGKGDSVSRQYGRYTVGTFVPTLQATISMMDEIDPAKLTAHAEAHTRVNETGDIHELVAVAGPDMELGAFHPGDEIRTKVPPGVDPWWPFGLDLTCRTIGFRVAVPDEHGPETVSFILEEFEPDA